MYEKLLLELFEVFEAEMSALFKLLELFEVFEAEMSSLFKLLELFELLKAEMSSLLEYSTDVRSATRAFRTGVLRFFLSAAPFGRPIFFGAFSGELSEFSDISG